MVLIAKDIVEKDFLSLRRDMTALEAAKFMKSSRHGFAVITAADGKPEGIVTEWDYLSKLVAEGKDASKVRLEEIMSPDLVTAKANDGVDRVAEMMAEKGIRRMLVMHEGKVIGVITATTVLTRFKEYVDRVSAQIARLQAPKL